VAGIVPSRLITYTRDDRSHTLRIWAPDGHVPRRVSTEDGVFRLTEIGRAGDGQPKPGDFLLREITDYQELAYQRALRWWNDGKPPLDDPASAQQMRNQYATFEQMYAHLERVAQVEAESGGKILTAYEEDA
jgi:hypothetical protein